MFLIASPRSPPEPDGTGNAAVPCSGHCTVPSGVPDEDEVADAPPVPSAPTPPPTASPVRASSAFGFTGAGPDLRPQMNACTMQRNALVQYASRPVPGRQVRVLGTLREELLPGAVQKRVESIVIMGIHSPQRAHLAV